MIDLVKDSYSCCGCGACMNICPKGAIDMREDPAGFKFPHIDTSKCIECGLCLKVCKFENPELVYPRAAYICQLKDENTLALSTSGGAFRAMAEKIIERGGVVFGCAYTENKDGLVPTTIAVDNIEELSKLSGSKYVQSEMGFAYKKAKGFLDKGRLVLFSGTPCHISGLYSYLGKSYDNLYTTDLICHGVPNLKMFQSELLRIEKKYKSTVKYFCFRDKSIVGWTWSTFMCSFKLGNGKSYCKSYENIAYFDLFLKGGDITRDSCSKCPYARQERVSDITIGDAWGAEIAHPNFEELKGGDFNFKKGLSLALINTERGENFFSDLCALKSQQVDYKGMAKFNKLLNSPIRQSPNRVKYMRAFEKSGISGLYSERLKIEWLPMLKRKIKKLIPNWIKQKLKKI